MKPTKPLIQSRYKCAPSCAADLVPSIQPPLAVFVAGQQLTFRCDRTFGPLAGQEEVFSELTQLVNSSMDGFKVRVCFLPGSPKPLHACCWADRVRREQLPSATHITTPRCSACCSSLFL